MDEQMSEKIKGLLSDPESLKSILSVASMLGAGGSVGENKDVSVKPSELVSESGESSNPTSGSPIQIPVNLKSKMSDDRVNLLLSIKPFLSETKRKRVDSLVKALGAAKLISAYKDTDILSKLGF